MAQAGRGSPIDAAPRPDAAGQNRKRLWRAAWRLCLAALASLLIVALGMWVWYTHRPQPASVAAELAPGVAYRRLVTRTPRALVVHVVRVDLDTPGLEFLVTPGDPNAARPLRARATSGFAREFGQTVAVNGDFFFPWRSRALWDYYPRVGDTVEVEGYASSRGVPYSRRAGKERFPVLVLGQDNRAGIAARWPDGPAWNAISGHNLLLSNGRTVVDPGDDRNPRTAVGLDLARRTLVLVVVDGRQPNYSEGCTLTELAEILREEGARNAINLDGGGSSTLVADTGGGPRVLNSPIDLRVPGRERPVANHLGLRVRRKEEGKTPPHSSQ